MSVPVAWTEAKWGLSKPSLLAAKLILGVAAPAAGTHWHWHCHHSVARYLKLNWGLAAMLTLQAFIWGPQEIPG